MHTRTVRSRIFTAAIAVLACTVPALGQAGPALAAQQLPQDNPFARPSTLPYRVPPFDRIKDADFRPAFDAGMAEERKEIEAIDRNPAPPSFENTVVALEKSGQLLDRVGSVFFNLNGSNTNPEIQKIASEMAPKLAAHRDVRLRGTGRAAILRLSCANSKLTCPNSKWLSIAVVR